MSANRPTNRRSRPTGITVLTACLACALLGPACGSPPPRAPNPTRPLDERRAVQIIAKAFDDERDRATMGHPVVIGTGQKLRVDISAAGRKYGVAYVTAGERQALGDALPRPVPGMEDALQLVRGNGGDADARILVLHDTNYLYDDQVGTQHEETILTAERKLARDVRDFVVRAHAENWP